LKCDWLELAGLAQQLLPGSRIGPACLRKSGFIRDPVVSEAEYEYATRARSTTIYYWGEEKQKAGKPMANCAGCGSEWDGERSAPVGKFPPNDFGLYDMVGNVWAWVEDCYHENYNGAPENGLPWIADGDCEIRMVRGGAWNYDPNYVRSSSRFPLNSYYRYYYQGFRIARTLTQ
jgi:formylglycine-generating enzyme required for sulfatase activity